MSLADADSKFYAEEEDAEAGNYVRGIGDLDGDGAGDFVIGANKLDSDAGDSAGGAYLFLGPVTPGVQDMSLADAVLLGEAEGDRAGFNTGRVGDMDGDGLMDIYVGASEEGTGGSGAGAVYLLYGVPSGETSLGDADAKLIGEVAGDSAKVGIGPGDVNGDGNSDFLVGASGYDNHRDGAGAAYLLAGPLTGEVDLEDALARITGSSAGDKVGANVEACGDVNQDGLDDLMFGANGRSEDEENAGAVFVVFGPITGTYEATKVGASSTATRRPGVWDWA